MTGWTDTEEEAVTAALTGIAWELRFMIAKAKLVLDRGPLDDATAQELTGALKVMTDLRGQLEAIVGPRAAHRPDIVRRD